MAYKRIGDLLLSIGLITEEELNQALEIQKDTKKRLGTVLTEYHFISEQQLIEARELQLGVEFIDLSKTIIPPEMAQVVPKNIARKYGVVPVKLVKDELYLAMSDPLNFVAIEEVKNVTRKRVIPMIAAEDADRAVSAVHKAFFEA